MSSQRGVVAGFGAIGATTGAALLYFGALPMGVILLAFGCLGLVWSIGGFGERGDGGSDS